MTTTNLEANLKLQIESLKQDRDRTEKRLDRTEKRLAEIRLKIEALEDLQSSSVSNATRSTANASGGRRARRDAIRSVLMEAEKEVRASFLIDSVAALLGLKPEKARTSIVDVLRHDDEFVNVRRGYWVWHEFVEDEEEEDEEADEEEEEGYEE